jgi:hypothetical protein
MATFFQPKKKQHANILEQLMNIGLFSSGTSA